MTFVIKWEKGGHDHWIGRETKWWSLYNVKYGRFHDFVLSSNILNEELSEMKDSVLGCQCELISCDRCPYAKAMIEVVDKSIKYEKLPVF